MRTLNDTVFHIYNRLLQKNSNLVFSRVLSTPPMRTTPDADTVLYSLLGNRDRRAYILAAKSLLRFCNNFRVVVQNDGSIDEEGCREIAHHIKGVEILSVQESDALIKSAANPEIFEFLPDLFAPTLPINHKILKFKLLNILYRYRHKRVVMIDSDIICCRSPSFILDWMKRTEPSYFYGGGGSQQAQDFHRLGFDFSRVDIANFNSGVMGVYNDVEEGELIRILERIKRECPSLMSGWEIEQSLWAVLLGARPNATNLDALQNGYITSGWKTYQRMKEKAIFVHFVGAIRFRNLRYLRLASDTYGELRS
ncbi:hypothetical protein [Povalibacter sp.]|uniref:hypothetical protein n=1 Tax=Povalibacter sp. TaxID=1962978 RepID=UPI002F41DCB9